MFEPVFRSEIVFVLNTIVSNSDYLDFVLKLDLCLPLPPKILQILLNRFVLKPIENCVYCRRADHEKLNETSYDVDYNPRGSTVACLRRGLLIFPVETNDDDEEIIGTVQNDDRCNQLENDYRSFLTFLPQFEWIRLWRVESGQWERLHEHSWHRWKRIFLVSDCNLR